MKSPFVAVMARLSRRFGDGHVSGFGPVLPRMASALVVMSILPRVR